jgi:hypothetical protein
MTDKSSIRVLFLDIDGVLNSHKTCLAYGGIPHGLTPEDVAMLDPMALEMLRALCDTADLSVVVSSSWRILHHWDAIGRALELPTMDATPRLPGCRGDEIAAWLETSPFPVEAYAIVDDDSDMLPDQMPRFVKTQHAEGLSYANFEALCGLFAVNPYDCHRKTRQRVAEARGG